MPALTPEERAILEQVYDADRDEGGLSVDELGADARTIALALAARGLVEDKGDYLRVTAEGVRALRED